jgi:hypothetical protein
MWNWMMLGLESNRVMRIAKLMRGGKAAQREAQRMVSEKMVAAGKASSLMAGASGDRIVEQYRRKVAANAKRLSRKRTRRKRRSS